MGHNGKQLHDTNKWSITESTDHPSTHITFFICSHILHLICNTHERQRAQPVAASVAITMLCHDNANSLCSNWRIRVSHSSR